MELAEAVRVIAEHHNLSASELQLLLDAVTRTPYGRQEWINLARAANSGCCGKTSINFDHGNITDNPKITTPISSLVKVGKESP